MSADDGMDAVDWRARAEAAERKLAQAEHSIRVLRDHVDTLRERTDDRMTVWDRYACTVLGAYGSMPINDEVGTACRIADAMMTARARRSHQEAQKGV